MQTKFTVPWAHELPSGRKRSDRVIAESFLRQAVFNTNKHYLPLEHFLEMIFHSVFDPREGFWRCSAFKWGEGGAINPRDGSVSKAFHVLMFWSGNAIAERL